MAKHYVIRKQLEGNMYRQRRLALGLRIVDITKRLSCSSASVHFAEVDDPGRHSNVGHTFRKRYGRLLTRLENKGIHIHNVSLAKRIMMIQKDLNKLPVFEPTMTAVQAVRVMMPKVVVADISEIQEQLSWEMSWL